jgi:hypothetical protein
VNEEETVLLCLKAFGIPDTGLMDEIGKYFQGLFNRSQHLDIMFLREEQERDVAAVCPPFYDRASCAERRGHLAGPRAGGLLGGGYF